MDCGYRLSPSIHSMMYRSDRIRWVMSFVEGGIAPAPVCTVHYASVETIVHQYLHWRCSERVMIARMVASVASTIESLIPIGQQSMKSNLCTRHF